MKKIVLLVCLCWTLVAARPSAARPFASPFESPLVHEETVQMSVKEKPAEDEQDSVSAPSFQMIRVSLSEYFSSRKFER